MAQVIQMSTDQLKELIEQLNGNAAAVAATKIGDAAVASKSKRSIGNISQRFGGQRDHEAVEEFITNVVTYKEIEMISDEDALKGISLLFYGIASTWWQGVRKEAKTWNDAISLIREHFSPAKPSYQIYMEIFEKKQEDGIAIDTFVCQKRALFAQLPDGRHDEETELDFIYGLLNIKYRKYIPRHDIGTFRDLLEKGRIIEHNHMEEAPRHNVGTIHGLQENVSTVEHNNVECAAPVPRPIRGRKRKLPAERVQLAPLAP